MRYLYGLLAYLLVPLYAGSMLWKGLRDRAWWARFSERFGHGAGTPAEAVIWVHAVSVGEVQAATALVQTLAARYPRRTLVLTTVTPSGAARARAVFGERVQVRFLPFDLPGSVRRFLERVRPTLAIVLETEIWPNLFHACGVRGIPLVLANARISARSVRRYGRVPGLIGPALSRALLIAAQSRTDAERFVALGAAPERTRVTGNLKFDIALPPEVVERGTRLRAEFAPGTPMWVAGSTHASEEPTLLAAHRRVRAQLPGTLLVLAPRHPERFDEVAAWLERQRIPCLRRSSGARPGPEVEVLLLDTLGELVSFYAAADVAFVAGSLAPIGGHNLLEPAALGRPILAGPYNFNAPEIALLLGESGALQLVADAPALASALGALLGDEAERLRRGTQARAAVDRNRGALARLLDLITPYLTP